MTGEMALLVTVASYGNEFLKDGSEKLDCRTHTSFSHYDIYFKDRSFRIFGKKITTDANGWFEYLKQNGCKKLRLFYEIQDSNNYSFALLPKSAQWITETIYDAHSDYWTCKWEYYSGRWYIEYKPYEVCQPIIDKQSNLALIKTNLYEKLDRLNEFAHTNGLSKDSLLFHSNKMKLYSDLPDLPEYHHDLIVANNYSILARQLLYTAVSSWCFTGMGSWADNCIFSKDDAQLKDELTQELYFAVCDAIMYSINSY